MTANIAAEGAATLSDDEDELTELTDADFPRVDLVGKGANGIPRFLIAKQEGSGLLEPGFVRDLIAKAEPEPARAAERVTMTGSPAAMAAFIRKAAARQSERVAKDMGPQLDDGMDPAVPLAAPEDDDVPGDPTGPASPAWEAIDAATAQKWTSILARSRVAIDLLAEREMLEAASADPDDAGNALDLQDACGAIDYVISVLAPYAVSEQSSSDTGAADMEAIGKAMASDLGASLSAIEGLAAIRKAGRVLSSANEAAIRAAAQSLQKVLASLPAAPAEAEPAAAARPEEAAPAVTKAGDGNTAQVAVYDSEGRLVGVADPAAIQQLGDASAPAKAAPGADEITTDEREVLKSIVTEAVAGALAARAPAAAIRGRAQQHTVPTDVAKAVELRKVFKHGTVSDRNTAAIEMQEMAISRLSAIHAGRGLVRPRR